MGKLVQLVKKASSIVQRVILRRRSTPSSSITKAAQNVWNRAGRLLLVDGTNVACDNPNSSHFSVSKLQRCLDALGNSNVYAIVPQFRLKKIYSSDNQMLQRMQKEGSVIITPGKDLNGRVLTCNPNPFILDIAKLTDASIVSNYDFRAEQQLDAAFPQIVRNNLIGFNYNAQTNDFQFNQP